MWNTKMIKGLQQVINQGSTLLQSLALEVYKQAIICGMS